VISPDRRREAVAQAQQVQEELDVSERRACRVIGQPGSWQRYDKRVPDDEHILREQILQRQDEMNSWIRN